MTGKKKTKTLEQTLWEAADKLRGNQEPSEYKHVVLGLVFLKYISDRFIERRQEIKDELVAEDVPTDQLDHFLEDRDEYAGHNVFWVPARARWLYLQNNAKQPNIGQLIDAAMQLIEKENSSLRGVLPRNYAREGLDQLRLGELVDCIVALPDKLFLNTPIPACLWFLSRNRHGNGHRRRVGEVLFIDARRLGRMLTRARRELTPEDIAKIAGSYNSWRSRTDFARYADEPGFCQVAVHEVIAENDYVLTPGRYVGIPEAKPDKEPLDQKIARLKTELFAEFERGHKLEVEIKQRLGGLK